MKDVLTGEEWEVRAKVVINATGMYTSAPPIYIQYMPKNLNKATILLP